MYKLVCGCIKWVSICFQRVIVGLHVDYNVAILSLSECVESMSHFYSDMLPFRTFVHFTGKLWCVRECKPSYLIYSSYFKWNISNLFSPPTWWSSCKLMKIRNPVFPTIFLLKNLFTSTQFFVWTPLPRTAALVHRGSAEVLLKPRWLWPCRWILYRVQVRSWLANETQ